MQKNIDARGFDILTLNNRVYMHRFERLAIGHAVDERNGSCSIQIPECPGRVSIDVNGACDGDLRLLADNGQQVDDVGITQLDVGIYSGKVIPDVGCCLLHNHGAWTKGTSDVQDGASLRDRGTCNSQAGWSVLSVGDQRVDMNICLGGRRRYWHRDVFRTHRGGQQVPWRRRCGYGSRSTHANFEVRGFKMTLDIKLGDGSARRSLKCCLPVQIDRNGSYAFLAIPGQSKRAQKLVILREIADGEVHIQVRERIAKVDTQNPTCGKRGLRRIGLQPLDLHNLCLAVVMTQQLALDGNV